MKTHTQTHGVWLWLSITWENAYQITWSGIKIDQGGGDEVADALSQLDCNNVELWPEWFVNNQIQADAENVTNMSPFTFDLKYLVKFIKKQY